MPEVKKILPKIKCPYCFKKFNHDEVHFRINERTAEIASSKLNALKSRQSNLPSSSSTSATTNPDLSTHSSDDLIDEKKVNEYKKYLRLDEIDPLYYEVWGENKGGSAPQVDRELFYFPHVEKNNLKSMTKTGSFIRNPETGFVLEIEDGLEGCELISRTRICPHCHNYLPGRYGENEQIFISILGVSSSGKTVFIKQLMKKLQTVGTDGILAHVNAALVSCVLPKNDNESLRKGEHLPDSTSTVNFKVPYFLTVSFKKENGEIKKYNIVLYDIAGENLIVDEGDSRSRDRFDFFGGFIKHSNAIITLIDPNQLVEHHLMKNKWPATQMVNTLYTIFGNEKIKIPTAFALSKSDMLRENEIINQELERREFFRNIDGIFENICWDNNKRYFYKDSHNYISQRVLSIFNVLIPGLDGAIRNNFIENSVDYFAISSLIDGVEQRLCFKLEPYDKVWTSSDFEKILSRFPLMNSNNNSNKLHFIKEKEEGDQYAIDDEKIYIEKQFILNANKSDFLKIDKLLSIRKDEMSNRNAIVEKINEIFGDINFEEYKINLFDRSNDVSNEIYLSISDFIKYLTIRNIDDPEKMVNLDVSIVGYPSHNGNLDSRRIEEPLFWVFSKLNLIDAKNFNDNSDYNNHDKEKKETKKIGFDSLKKWWCK